jgi:hypothetical protein
MGVNLLPPSLLQSVENATFTPFQVDQVHTDFGLPLQFWVAKST